MWLTRGGLGSLPSERLSAPLSPQRTEVCAPAARVRRAQLPAEHCRGHAPGDHPDMVVRPILVRADSAGAARGCIDGLVARKCEFSISARVSQRFGHPLSQTPPPMPGGQRSTRTANHAGAQIAELDLTVDGWPAGTRAIVRCERPHPGGPTAPMGPQRLVTPSRARRPGR